MPTYEYVCEECGYEFQKFQKMSEEHLKCCPECGKEKLKRKIGTGAGIIFKGSGFYCTDYAHNGASPSKEQKSGSDKEKPAACSPAHEHTCHCGCKH